MSKKRYIELEQVREFKAAMPLDARAEYELIVRKLETDGYLTAPYGEKVEKGLFAVRIMQAANERVFYVYGLGSNLYGIHAYEKKTAKIPLNELKQARRKKAMLEREGLI